MNKQNLIDAVAEDANLTKAQAKLAVDAVLGNIAGSLSVGNEVTLVGFGTFSVKEVAARTGRNPQTGKKIEIPAKRKAAFKAGKVLNDQVN